MPTIEVVNASIVKPECRDARARLMLFSLAAGDAAIVRIVERKWLLRTMRWSFGQCGCLKYPYAQVTLSSPTASKRRFGTHTPALRIVRVGRPGACGAGCGNCRPEQHLCRRARGADRRA